MDAKLRLDRAWLLGGMLVAVTVLLYVPAMGSGTVFDDGVFVFEDPLIRASDGLRRFWFSTEPPDYFPLTSSMLWLEWRVWGEDPAGYHVVNVLLHAASCVLLWRVLARLEIPGAFLAALIFAVHPVNVESVAWITQRKNTLPMVFYLLSALLYLRSEDEEVSGRRRWGAYAGSLGVFLLALLAKTSVVILPPVLLLCAWWRRGRVTREDARRVAPFFALSVILGLVTVWYQTYSNIGSAVVRSDGFLSRLAIAARAVWFYLYKALVPVNLTMIYPRWEIEERVRLMRTGAQADIGSFLTYVPLLLLVAAFGLLWRHRRGWGRPFFFASSYYVLALLPVLGFVDIYFMRYSLVADHWQYTALLGVAALLAAAWSRLRAKAHFAAWLVSVSSVALMGALTWRQQAAYANDEALWSDTRAKNPTAWIAHYNLGRELELRGALEEAVACYREALRLEPAYVDAHFNLGHALGGLGRLEEALHHYGEAQRLTPDSADLHNNMGVALHVLGRYEEAAEHYAEALRLVPDHADTHFNLGLTLQSLGRFEDAAQSFRAALRLDPTHAEAACDLGLALRELGRIEEALESFEEALRLQPDLAKARFYFGDSLQRLGRLDEAVAQYEALLEAEPNEVAVRYALGNALRASGRYQAAVPHFEAVLGSQPNDPFVLNEVAWFLATCPDPLVRNGPRALELAERAMKTAGEGNAALLGTLAAAHAAVGNFAGAVLWQEKAIALTAPDDAPVLRKRLDSYRSGNPWREGPGE